MDFTPKIQRNKVAKYIFLVKMIFIVVYILQKFGDEGMKNDKPLSIFVVFRIEQTVYQSEKMSKL
jgi:hypothetical protein